MIYPRIPALVLILWLIAPCLTAADRPTVIVVTGAPGTTEYRAQFAQWTAHWKTAATQGYAAYHEIPTSSKQAADLKTRLATETQTGQTPLWLVLIGHGTFDGKTAKFNLHGPDLTAAELKTWLADGSVVQPTPETIDSWDARRWSIFTFSIVQPYVVAKLKQEILDGAAQ